MRRSPAALRRTAIHEAGHAVVATVFGLDVREVSIVPDLDECEAGFCIYAVDLMEIMGLWDTAGIWHRTARSARRASAIALLAGIAAEREMLGRLGPGAGDDRPRAGWLVDDLTPLGGSVRHTLARLEKAAAVLMRQHRDTLAMLVDALLAQRTMTGEAVRELVASRTALRAGLAL